MIDDIVYLGIDLGSSRTSITSSTGVRETVWSFVGYAEDHVAKKKLGGREVIYGKEAVDNRMALKLYRPLAGGTLKMRGADSEENKRAVRDLLEHAVSLAKVPAGKTIYAVIGAPAEASVEGKAAIIEAASGCIDSVIVCSEPFAVAYGLDHLDDTLVVDIGAGTVDLCRMHGTLPAPEDQLTLTTAGDWLDQQLFTLFKRKAPNADFTIHHVKDIKEKFAFVSDVSEAIRVEFLVDGKPTVFDITDEIREGCRMMVPPIVKSLHKLVSTFDPDFQKKLRDNVLVAGGGSQLTGLDRILEQAMREMLGSGKVTRVEEPMYAGANGALKMAHDMPEEYWTRLG